MKKYITRVTRISVLPQKEPLFSEQCTHVTIVDEAAGEYIEIEQQSGNTDVKAQTIGITPDEWPAIKQAVETLLMEIQSEPTTP
jgi:DNA-binding transcriptional regulator LsrR (DeoR family)